MSTSTKNKRANVAIFGASAAEVGRLGQEPMAAAEALGRACAARGWTIVNGGYGGTMLAAARGANLAGGRAIGRAIGRSIGVVCSIYQSPPNEFITDPVWTATPLERLSTIIDLGDAYVALPGSTGTLAELAWVWESANKRLIPPRPIICLGEYWRGLARIFDQGAQPDPRAKLLTFVNGVEDAVRVIEQAFQSM